MSYLDAKPTDALGRRFPYVRNPENKNLRITENDVLLFEFLHRHGGKLPTPHIRAYMRQFRTSRSMLYDRLAYLYRENAKGGPYLDRLPTQVSPKKVSSTYVVHQLTDAAIKLLKDAGLYYQYAPTLSGSVRHQIMIACITASVDLMCRQSGNMRYMYQDEILAKAGKPLGYTVSFTDPKTKKPITKTLYPDAVFGIEYDTPQGLRYRLYLLEADRGTEPGQSYTFDRKSFERTIRQYDVFVGDKKYKEHLNTKAGVFVLNALTSELRERNLLRLTEDIHPDGCTYMLYKAFPTFHSDAYKPSGVLDEVMHNWQRAGHLPINIGTV